MSFRMPARQTQHRTLADDAAAAATPRTGPIAGSTTHDPLPVPVSGLIHHRAAIDPIPFPHRPGDDLANRSAGEPPVPSTGSGGRQSQAPTGHVLERLRHSAAAGAGTTAPTSAAVAPPIRRLVRLGTDSFDEVDVTSGKDLTTKLKLRQLKELDRLIDNPDVTFIFDSERDLVEYLDTGARHLVQIVDRRRPDLSPPHYTRPMDTSDTVYQLSGSGVPDYYDMPQSPRSDESERDTTRVDVAPGLESLTRNLQAAKKRGRAKSGIKTAKSTNVFRFSVQIDYRVAPLQQNPVGWILGDETERTISASSQIYQSSGTDLPAHEKDEDSVKRRRTSKAEVNERVRDAIEQANEAGYKFEQFAPLSVQAFARRKGKNDLRDVQEKRKGSYVLKNTTIASACFHSETQALGMAPVEVPPLVSGLIDSMIHDLPNGPHQIVVNTLQVQGASVPNSVCGNACKPALLTLLNQIEDAFVGNYQARKSALRKQGVYFRRSGEYVATMNVVGVQKFQGFGTGARAIPTVTIPSHGVVNEFPPD